MGKGFLGCPPDDPLACNFPSAMSPTNLSPLKLHQWPLTNANRSPPSVLRPQHKNSRSCWQSFPSVKLFLALQLPVPKMHSQSENSHFPPHQEQALPLKTLHLGHSPFLASRVFDLLIWPGLKRFWANSKRETEAREGQRLSQGHWGNQWQAGDQNLGLSTLWPADPVSLQ